MMKKEKSNFNVNVSLVLIIMSTTFIYFTFFTGISDVLVYNVIDQTVDDNEKNPKNNEFIIKTPNKKSYSSLMSSNYSDENTTIYYNYVKIEVQFETDLECSFLSCRDITHHIEAEFNITVSRESLKIRVNYIYDYNLSNYAGEGTFTTTSKVIRKNKLTNGTINYPINPINDITFSPYNVSTYQFHIDYTYEYEGCNETIGSLCMDQTPRIVAGSKKSEIYDFDDYFYYEDDAYEPNNDPTSAYDLTSYSNTWLEDISGRGLQYDLDYYKVTIITSGSIIIELYNGYLGGLGIMLVDNLFNPLVTSNTTDYTEHIAYTHTGNETYYIVVDGLGLGTSYNLKYTFKAKQQAISGYNSLFMIGALFAISLILLSKQFKKL